MTVEQEQPSIEISWTPSARSDLRRIDKTTAISILRCLARYAKERSGDIKKLKPPLNGFRLRCGEYRLFFDHVGEETIVILAVRHRKDAYR